ncbi:MAG: class I SAM-dependent methyltransferase [Planctomycetota bacterium]|jgi:predicted O-methyltransferase YrrM
MFSDEEINEIYQKTGTRMPPADCQFLYRTATEIKAKILVEIGAAGGGSSVILGQVAREQGGHHWSIDPQPEGRWRPNIIKYGLEEFVSLVWGPSPWVGTGFLPGPIDYLFVDGDHRTTSALMDMAYWGHKLRVGGLLGLHDICSLNWRGINIAGNMERAVELLIKEYPFRAKDRQKGSKGGIALLEKTADYIFLK